MGHHSCSHEPKTNTGTWSIDVRITSSYELLTSLDSSAQIAYWQLYVTVCASNRYLQWIRLSINKQLGVPILTKYTKLQKYLKGKDSTLKNYI